MGRDSIINASWWLMLTKKMPWQLGLSTVPCKCHIYGYRNTVPITISASLYHLGYHNQLTGPLGTILIQLNTAIIQWYQILVRFNLKIEFSYTHIHRKIQKLRYWESYWSKKLRSMSKLDDTFPFVETADHFWRAAHAQSTWPWLNLWASHLSLCDVCKIINL